MVCTDWSHVSIDYFRKVSGQIEEEKLVGTFEKMIYFLFGIGMTWMR